MADESKSSRTVVVCDKQEGPLGIVTHLLRDAGLTVVHTQWPSAVRRIAIGQSLDLLVLLHCFEESKARETLLEDIRRGRLPGPGGGFVRRDLPVIAVHGSIYVDEYRLRDLNVLMPLSALDQSCGLEALVRYCWRLLDLPEYREPLKEYRIVPQPPVGEGVHWLGEWSDSSVQCPNENCAFIGPQVGRCRYAKYVRNASGERFGVFELTFSGCGHSQEVRISAGSDNGSENSPVCVFCSRTGRTPMPALAEGRAKVYGMQRQPMPYLPPLPSSDTSAN